MELIALAAALIAVSFIGFNMLYLIAGRLDKFYLSEAVFISYALGIGFISLGMLKFYLLGIKFSVPGLLISWTALVALNVYFYLRSGSGSLSFRKAQESEEKNKLLNIFLTFGIALEVFYAFFRALIKPIEAYDAVAIYAIKAKIFFLGGTIPQNYFPGLVHTFPHPDYPLNIPLAETFMYMFMKGLNDQLVKIIFPLFFVAILCILYFAIRRFASRTYALVFTFLLASVPQFNAYASNAYQELPLAFYYFASAILLFAWIDNKKDLRLLILSAVMAALGGWTKNEGLMYCVINTFLVVISAFMARKDTSWKTILAPIFYVAIIAIILAPWMWIKHKFGLVNDEINILNLNPAYLLKQLNKLGPIFYELQKQLFGPKKWNILWPAVIFAAILNYRKIFAPTLKYISISIALAFSGYILFYMISYVDVVFFASKTWSRFLLHFLPLVVLWLAHIMKEDIKL